MREGYGEAVYTALRKIELAERYLTKIEAERDRFREALERIANMPDLTAATMAATAAREALEQ